MCAQKAEAQLAYELQAARIKQRIRNEDIEIDVVERRKQIDIEAKEIIRKEKELIGTVKLPAEAEAYKMQLIAEGRRFVFFSLYVFWGKLWHFEAINRRFSEICAYLRYYEILICFTN